MPVTKVKVNGEWIPAMPVGGGGEGDMTKAVYDTNDDGVVNAADLATKDGSGNVITSTYAAKATTLSGYGITDAKIENGSIILGSNSITPLTSFTETDPVFTASAAYGISSSDISNWNGKADSATTLSGYGITDASISNRTITLGSNTITVPENMVILSYGTSTWNDFINAYNTNRVVYCRASSNSNPASGSQTRLAFMAYVNNGDSPTEVEFQYYRSVSSHSASQQGDQVFVYKLTSSGTWTVTTREADSKIAVTSPVSSSYSSGTITLSLADAYGDTQNPYGTKTANYVLAGPTSGNASAPTFRALVADDIPSLTASKISDISLSNGTITIGNNSITPLTSAPVTSVNGLTGAVVIDDTGTFIVPVTVTWDDQTQRYINPTTTVDVEDIIDAVKDGSVVVAEIHESSDPNYKWQLCLDNYEEITNNSQYNVYFAAVLANEQTNTNTINYLNNSTLSMVKTQGNTVIHYNWGECYIPSATSDLTNDSGFIVSNTTANFTVSDTAPSNPLAGDVWIDMSSDGIPMANGVDF